MEVGVLDNPFGTNPYVAGKVLGARDSEGAVRYVKCDNLPFTKDIIEFHKEKIAMRSKKLGREVNFDTIADDISAISAGFFLSYKH
jgi:methylaspartate mutase epsilon subunit